MIATTVFVSTTSTTSASTTTTTLSRPIPVLAIITPSGVPAAVLRTLTSGQVILTPCGNERLIRGGAPFGRTSVVVDPGHGGQVDTGAVAPTGLPEKEINLLVAQAVERILIGQGISAVLTRSGDYASPLNVRAHLADTVGADLMVSIHHNAPSPGPSAEPGIEVFVQDGSSRSERLGGLLWEQAMEALDVFEIAWVAADDAGVMTVLNSGGDDAYGIIRHPRTPTALIELGYISNQAEAELYRDPRYVPVAAGAIARAIVKYLQSEDEGSGFVEGRVFDPRPGIAKDACSDPDMGG